MAPEPTYRRLPFRKALAWLRQKTPLPTTAWDDLVNEAQDWAFTVSGITKAEALQEIYDLTTRAIESGELFRDFQQQLRQTLTVNQLAPLPEWRQRLILMQNLRSAYGAGRYRQQTDPDTMERRPYFLYRHDDPITPRPHHQALDGFVARANDPVWATLYAPNGYGCRCKVYSLNARQLEAEGYSLSDPLPTVQVYDRRDGMARSVPAVRVEGLLVPAVDPGFAYAPGASQPQQRAAILQQALTRLTPALQRMVKAALNFEESVDFAAPKKARQCKKGYSCGSSCISKSKTCRVPLEGDAAKAAKWLQKYAPKALAARITEDAIADAVVNTGGLLGSIAGGALMGPEGALFGDLAGALAVRGALTLRGVAAKAKQQLSRDRAVENMGRIGKIGAAARATVSQLRDPALQLKLGDELTGDVSGWAVGNASASALNQVELIASVPLKGAAVAMAVVPKVVAARRSLKFAEATAPQTLAELQSLLSDIDTDIEAIFDGYKVLNYSLDQGDLIGILQHRQRPYGFRFEGSTILLQPYKPNGKRTDPSRD
ncbi:MAG TPA: phage minor head protein [Trichocoleus sp.]